MADDGADVNDAYIKPVSLRVRQEAQHTIRALSEMDPSIFADTFEAYRQQGRDEVLREIARKTPHFEERGPNGEPVMRCRFCWAWGALGYKPHEPDCVWVRASKVGK